MKQKIETWFAILSPAIVILIGSWILSWVFPTVWWKIIPAAVGSTGLMFFVYKKYPHHLTTCVAPLQLLSTLYIIYIILPLSNDEKIYTAFFGIILLILLLLGLLISRQNKDEKNKEEKK